MSVESDYDVSDDRVFHLLMKKADLELDIAKLERQVDVIPDLEEKLAMAAQRAAEAQETRRKTELELQKWEKLVEQVTRERDEARDALARKSAIEEDISKLEDEIATAKAEIADSQAKTAELDEKLQAAEAKKSALMVERAAPMVEHAALKAEYAAPMAKLAALETQKGEGSSQQDAE